jgi:hypothetical protein
MTAEVTVHLYRCVLDGQYFADKGMALTHLKIAHGISSDESPLREVTFPCGVER